MDGYVVVGALARVDQECRPEVCSRIDAMAGFSTFAVEDPLKVGVLIEARSLDEAHQRFTDQLTVVDGVLGAWPVSVECDEGFEADDQENPTTIPIPARDPGTDTHTPSFKSEVIR